MPKRPHPPQALLWSPRSLRASRSSGPPRSGWLAPGGVRPVAGLAHLTSLLALLALFAWSGLAGCGGGATVSDRDATPGRDATPMGDAARLSDAEPNGDSAVNDEDLDQDGYPASQDCNDLDSAVYPGVVRDCASDCDTGTETCLSDGTWSECTARPDCDCTSPGDTRVTECGNCGQATQECGLDLKWSTTGPCINEGPCSPGEQGHVSCPYCGTGLRICQTDCTWGQEDCSGVCHPGEYEVTMSGCSAAYERQKRGCDATCQWNVAQSCTTDCLLPARQGNGDFKDEVCIPGGPFIMGRLTGEGHGVDEPRHEVALSPYFIDKYEVTNARYLECINQGACAAPMGSTASDVYAPEKATWPVTGVTWTMAYNFCLWDGGRTLPTEAQWEKAARGPSPREPLNPWGDAPGDCTTSGGHECTPPAEWHPMPVYAYPAGVSYYNIYNLGGNVCEYTLDWWSETYYQVSSTLDPPGPATGVERTSRGFFFNLELAYMVDSATYRRSEGLQTYDYMTGLRCARQGY